MVRCVLPCPVVRLQRTLPERSTLTRSCFDAMVRVSGFCDVGTLCALALCCRGLGDAARSDSVWLPLVVGLRGDGLPRRSSPLSPPYLEASNASNKGRGSSMDTHVLLERDDREMEGEAQEEELYARLGSWHAVYIYLRKPPPIPPMDFSWDWIMVPVMLLLNTCDFATDLAMCVYFHQQPGRRAWFLASFFTFYVGPALMSYMDWHKSRHTAPRDYRRLLASVCFNFLQLRLQAEAIGYFIGLWKRARLTGKQVQYVTSESESWNQAQRERSQAVHIVKLIEATFESLPQSVLQLAFVFIYSAYTFMALSSILLSVVSVTLAVCFFEKPGDVSGWQLASRVSLIASGCVIRAVATAMFASSFGLYVFLPLCASFAVFFLAVPVDSSGVFLRFLLATGNLLLPFVERVAGEPKSTFILVWSGFLTLTMTVISAALDPKQPFLVGKLALQGALHALSAVLLVTFYRRKWKILGSS